MNTTTHENLLQQESSDSFISELLGTDYFAFLKMSGILALPEVENS